MVERRGPARVACVAALLTTLAALALPSGTGQASVARATATSTAGTFSLPAGPVTADSEVAARGSLPPRHSRPIRLQMLRKGTWSTVTEARTNRRGKFLLGISAPRRSGEHRYRVVAPRTTIGGRTYRSVTTPTRTLSVLRLTSVDVGWRHTCTLADTGDAWCWGDNTYGELGDASTPTFTDQDPTIAPHPMKVVGRRWASVATSGASTCGVKDDGTAWCWGDLATYQFPADPYRAGTPQQVAGSWSQLAPGAALYWCGVDDEGTGWCQGSNTDGQLGDPDAGGSVATALPGTWIEVVPGSGFDGQATTCGIRSDLSAWCWGAGTFGQLGNDANDDSPVPVEVAGDHEWQSLSVGGIHVCGVDTAGAGWCWGHNQDGRLGTGTVVASSVPVRVSVATAWSSIDAGSQHTCGTTTGGDGWCWGWNDDGQLGAGTSDTTYFPEPVPSLLEGSWGSVAAGERASAGTAASGSAYAWGQGTFGQLGFGEGEESTVPRHVFP